MPLDRGARYEDPLLQALEEEGYGTVDGAGTMTTREGEIEYCGLDIELSNMVQGVPFICDFLTKRGAAKGSTLEIREGASVSTFAFGSAEGIGIYFDGVNLPDEVYRDCDINVVLAEFARLLGQEGEIRGHWQGPTETALYIYGRSAQTMRSLLAGYLNTYPLCKGARVVDITPQ